jgi:virulence-associated protein VagC
MLLTLQRHMAELPYAWLGDVQTFLDTPEDEILRKLTAFAKETGSPQVLAWDRTLRTLRDELGACLPDVARFALVLEFEVPRSGGRRPDLIILENGTVLVVEFKNRVEAEPADIDQVLGYAQELADYHAGCHERLLIPVLIPIGLDREPYEQRGVQVVPPRGLGTLIRKLAKGNGSRRGDARAWVNAPYAPLPALTQAARLLFERQPLPQIKRAESAKIPEAVNFLEEAIHDVRARGGHLLAIVTGVPGSGKTLLGLQVAHSRRLEVPTIFLSGNGPLVQVLKYSLGRGAHVFVQDMRAFLKQHGGSKGPAPPERVVVFDEAQRAWDRDRVLQRHQGQLAASEPELLVQIGNRVADGFALIVLIGEGQEIHTGEESGIGQWASAVKGGGGWNVIGPPHLAAAFRAAGILYQEEQLLGLTTSLRSHRASDVALWTGLLLEGRLDEAQGIADGLRQAGFVLRISRSLGAVQQYVRDRYSGEPSKRFGLIASSKFRTLSQLGVRTARHPYWYYGQWFEAAPTDPHSGCRLETALSEFGCQGLELDLPLICWGPDCRWDGSAWVTKTGRTRNVRDPHRLRLNAYRVLLTRGRDGVAVFVPSGQDMDSTFAALCRAGFEEFG